MIDLNNSIFYKVKFNVSAISDDTDLIQRIISHIKTWLLRKHNQKRERIPEDDSVWNRLVQGDVIESTDKGNVLIETDSFQDEGLVFWACRISERGRHREGYAPREWITEIGIKPISHGEIEFSCVTSYRDRPGFIGQCEDEPQPNIPNIVKALLNDEECNCKLGCECVDVNPIALKPGDWNSFWENTLNEERQLPYIFVSLKSDGESGNKIHLVNPQELAIAAGGNAKVFYAESDGVIDEMNYYCQDEYKCYGGAIRIYFPQIRLDDPLDSHRHRYINPNVISEIGPNHVIQMIRRALAQDVHFYETFFRIEECRKKKESFARQVRLAEIKKQYDEEKTIFQQQHEQQVDKYFTLAVEEEEKRLKVEDELEAVKESLGQLKESCYRLSNEIEGYRTLSAKNAELQRVCRNRLNTIQYPNTILDVVNYFDAVFCDRLAFSEDGMKSLKGCRLPLTDLWRILFSLATEMHELYLRGSGDIYSQFRQKTGIDVTRGEGTMTRKDAKLMRQFLTLYNGEEINIEPHITFPKLSQSIHFGFSHKDQKIIVGSCGEHKEIYSTQKKR